MELHVNSIRTFETGATRTSEEGKFDYEGFLSPLALERFGAYMHKHRHLPDGSLRASDNWQAGIPLDSYAKSMFRHFFEFWKAHRGLEVKEEIEESLAALMFNVQGYLHELLKARAVARALVAPVDPIVRKSHLQDILRQRPVY